MNEMQLIKAGWKYALTVQGGPTEARNAAMIRRAIGNDTVYKTHKLPGGSVAVYTRK